MPDGLCECGCGEATVVAERTDTRQGKVKGQPQRFVFGHNRRKTPHDYVVDEKGCWIWQRSVNQGGYGHVKRLGRSMTASRWYYIERNGEIPEGLEVDHLCRTRLCVNPDHLELVTPAQNRYRGRNASLTVEQVHEIRRSSKPSRTLAPIYGVSHTTINDIRSGKRWKEV